MEESSITSRIGVLEILTPEEFCTTIALYGPSQSGKTTLLADDLPDQDVRIIDSTRTFPFHTGKEIIHTTNHKIVLNAIEANKTIVIDDIFVFRGDDLRKFTAKVFEVGARMIVVSQIRTFKEPHYYPYSESIVNNMNVCLKMEKYENRDNKLVSIIELVRKRGTWIEEPIRIPVIIENNRLHPETYENIANIVKLNNMEKP